MFIVNERRYNQLCAYLVCINFSGTMADLKSMSPFLKNAAKIVVKCASLRSKMQLNIARTGRIIYHDFSHIFAKMGWHFSMKNLALTIWKEP